MNIPRAFRPDALVLVVLALVIALVRAQSFREPPDWDIGTYLVVAHELGAGERLYLDVWDSKPPAVFATYAVAERVFGYGYRQTYWLSVLAAWVTLAGVSFAASAHGRAAGWWAAALWTCVCFEPQLGANQPNTEVFINAAVVWALALVLSDNGRLGLGRYVTVGLLFGAASMYKQVAVATAGIVMLAHVLWPAEDRTRRVALLQTATAALVGVLAWLAVYAYFALTGRAWIFAQTMIVHARWYGGNLLDNLANSFKPTQLFPTDARFVVPLVIAALLAVALPAGVQRVRPGRLLAAAAVGTHLAIAWPEKFFAHYYQLWLPVLCIAAGWGIVRLGAIVQTRARWVAPAVGAVVAICLIQPQFSWFALSGDEWAARKHGSFYERALLDARDIAATLKPGQTLYAWSDEAWLYFITNRRAPAAGLWKSHTLHGPLAPWLARRTVEDLERHQPDLLIDWTNLEVPEDHPVARFIQAHYRPLDDGNTRWPFVVYVRRS